ncbi:uncharacterized protein [Chelonus insularis]|uniref:uncharacterized protein n=1 Tax=Chelonus insularis TaxID=460826 RepID=UPI001588F50E|nr:uncharacterized protein LOC118064411 [Chelonus insularis]
MNSSKNKRSSKKLFDDDGSDANNSKKIHLEQQVNKKNDDLLNQEAVVVEDEVVQQRQPEKSVNTREFVGYSSFKGFKAYDKSIEIIAKVSGFSGPSEVGEDKNSLYKVDLVNDRGEKLQLAAWNDEIKRIAPYIKTNAILHIESVYCKPITKPKYNKGTENYELVVQSNTNITIQGHDDIGNNAVQLNRPAPLIKIRNLLVCGHQLIRTVGFIKTNFGLIKTLNARNQYICGSITDKHIKIEVRIHGIEDCQIPFTKGDHISLKGSIQVNANPVYILVEKAEDITRESDEKLSFARLMQITEGLDADSHRRRYDSDDNE